MESRSFFLRNCNSSCKLFQCYGSPEMTNERLNTFPETDGLPPENQCLEDEDPFGGKRPIFRG